jgi:uncharacterized protein with FMN-binding domain
VPKNPVNASLPVRRTSHIVYTPGKDPDARPAQAFSTGPNEYIGTGSGGMGGDITVKVRVVAGASLTSRGIMNAVANALSKVQ